MGVSAFAVAVVIGVSGVGQSYMHQEEMDEHSKAFKKYWGEDLVWRYDDLPEKGTVPKPRIPYSGNIYPDNVGGTLGPLSRYDRAYFGGRGTASAYERWEIANTKEVNYRPGGLFGLRQVRRVETPYWYGHCNGWTAAAIRHEEPQQNVTRNGVVFTPSDIKGLLAELYIFSETVSLAGQYDYVVNPASLHVTIANWIGRKQHPVGMENTPGKEVWNYPLYAYSTSTAKRYGGREVEVKMNAGYSMSTDQEHDRAPKERRYMYFHYQLMLNEKGEITGGYYYRDSNRIDLLWVPLKPAQGGKQGNERGNPHLNAKEVLAIWRDSVPKELRENWVNIDPTDEDRVLVTATDDQLAESTAEETTDAEEGLPDIDADETTGTDGGQ